MSRQAKRDRQTLERCYFLFLATLVSNGVMEVLSQQQPQHLNTVLLSVVQGAVELTDPVVRALTDPVIRELTDPVVRELTDPAVRQLNDPW